MRPTQIVKATVAGMALAAGLAWVSTPAVADHRRHRADDEYNDERYDDGHRRYAYHDDYDRPQYPRDRHFVVPNRIVFREVGHYRPYFDGRAYYRPHRHHHVIYSFPVYTPYGIVHRHFSYCPGPRGYVAFQGPQFGFQVGF